MLAQVRNPAGRARPRTRGPAVRQGARRSPPDRRPLALGARRRDPAESDLERSWRQNRPLAGRRRPEPGRGQRTSQGRFQCTRPAVVLTTRVRDAEFRPLDNAKVRFQNQAARGRRTYPGRRGPTARRAGAYAATYVTKQPGPIASDHRQRARTGARSARRRPAGPPNPRPTSSPASHPTGPSSTRSRPRPRGSGERRPARPFVASLNSRHAPIREPWTSPLWHQPFYFLIAIACLTAEWGLRRVSGLA